MFLACVLILTVLHIYCTAVSQREDVLNKCHVFRDAREKIVLYLVKHVINECKTSFKISVRSTFTLQTKIVPFKNTYNPNFDSQLPTIVN